MINKYILLVFFLFFAFSINAQRRGEKLYKKIAKYDNIESYEKVISAESEIITYASTHYDTTASSLLFILSVNHLFYDDLKKANKFMREGFSINDSIGWPSVEERFGQLYYLGLSYWYLEDYHLTDSVFTALIKLGNTVYPPTDDNILFVYQEYAKLLEEQGKLSLADSVLSYAIGKGVENQTSIPSLISYQALIANELGDYNRAKKLYYMSLEGLEGLKEEDPIAYASSLSNLGNLYYDLGQYPVSEQMQAKAIEEFNKVGLGDTENALSAMHNLAYTSNELGLRNKALKIYQKIIAIEKDSKKLSTQYALTLNNLGIVYHDAQNYDSAIFYFDQALQIFYNREGSQNQEYAITLNNKAKSFLYLNQYDSAVKTSLKALAIIRKVIDENNPEIAIYQHTLGLIYYAMGNYEKAEFYLKSSLEVRQIKLGKLSPMYAESAFELAKLMWALERYEQADIYFSSAFDSYLNQVKVFFSNMSEYERTKFYTEKIKPSVEIFYSYALSNPTSLLLEEMIYYRLQTKGLLYYSTSNVKRSILGSGDSLLVNNYNTWLEKREALAKLIQNNRSSEHINTLWNEVNSLEKVISSVSSSFSRSEKPLFLEDIQNQLNQDETAVEIIRYNLYAPENGGKKSELIHYAAIIITPEEKVDLVVIEDGTILESKYLYYYSNVIKFKRDDHFSFAQYWQPIADKLNETSTIYLSTDGVYNYININILFNPASEKYVLESKNIIPLTNLSDISNRSEQKTYDTPSAFFGYPAYDSLPVIENSINTSIEDKIFATENKASFEIVSSSLYANLISNSLFKPLPGTFSEVKQIGALYKKENEPYTLFLKEQATESAIKKVVSPSVLHIATHGFFLASMEQLDQAQPGKSNPLLQSGLVFAGAKKLQENPGLSNENGILTAYEAMNLNLTNTQLVVMSACETGLGTLSNGEGVYGLQRAFQIAGAQSVVMSMWTVDDTATQLLMTYFYSNWLQGQEKHMAFKNAQLKLKKTYKSPYYWGAFVMNGL